MVVVISAADDVGGEEAPWPFPLVRSAVTAALPQRAIPILALVINSKCISAPSKPLSTNISGAFIIRGLRGVVGTHEEAAEPADNGFEHR